MQAINRRQFLWNSGAALSLVPGSLRLSATSPTNRAETPLVLPPWQFGMLDIHHISTGRGSCAFLVCPDGTTLMIDAGSILTNTVAGRAKYLIDPKPNGSLRPGQWIARYVQRCLAEASRDRIDYFLLTHFHEDHYGEVAAGDFAASPLSRYGDYQLGGVTDVAERILIAKIIDRDYPSYDYPVRSDNPNVLNYRRFGQSLIQRGGSVERFRPGAKDQLALRHKPAEFQNFSIRNLAANGIVWTGIGDNTKEYFPKLSTLDAADYPTENKCSLAIRLSYGKFDYFSAGDMDHETRYGVWPWGDIESAVAKAAGPVDIAVADHHGWVDACGPDWVRALQAKVYVINAWDSAHPTMPSLNNMLSTELYAGERFVFATAMKPENVIATRRIAELKSQNGHVIFRVAPGGDSYEVFIKDNAIENGPVKARFGPFLSS